MTNSTLKAKTQSSFLKDCHDVLQIMSQKQEICTRLNLQLDFEYKLYKQNVLNNGDFPYRFRKCLDYLMANSVIQDNGDFLTLDKSRLDSFFNKIANNSQERPY